jgi:hypothetical protein
MDTSRVILIPGLGIATDRFIRSTSETELFSAETEFLRSDSQKQ